MRTALTASLTVILMGACGAADRQPKQSAIPGEAALLAATCTGCHLSGAKSTAIPALSDRSADDLRDALLAYQQDGETVMHRLMPGYTAAQIDALSAYFAQETPDDE